MCKFLQPPVIPEKTGIHRYGRCQIPAKAGIHTAIFVPKPEALGTPCATFLSEKITHGVYVH
jgi:hypothetical protein